MRKILTALMAFGLAFTMNAQTWQKIWSPAEDNLKAQWTYFWENDVGGLSYWEYYEIIAFECKDGFFDYKTVIRAPDCDYYSDVRIEFYKDSIISKQLSYKDCECSSVNIIILTKEETAPIWEWLTEGHNYSVRFIVKRHDMSDFDFTVTGK